VKIIEPPGAVTNFRKNMDFGVVHIECYDNMHKDLKGYFDHPDSHKWLLKPEDVAEKIVESIVIDSDIFRYQVGPSLEIAKEKLKEPRLIMKKYPFIIKAFKFSMRKIKSLYK
jgi:hypothetical protein